MRRTAVRWIGALVIASGFGASAAKADPPALVMAYAQGLVRQCGGTLTPALSADLIQRIDLNGDAIDDWLVDTSRFPCPSRPKAFADNGFQVTIFIGFADGHAVPAFQRAGFGARLEGKPQTGYALWLALGGSDCGGDSPKIRCDRRVVWKPTEHRFDLAEPASQAVAATKR